MQKLSLSLEKELEVMAKHSLTAEEWLMTKLLFAAMEPNSMPEYLYKYVNECSKTGVVRETLESLKKKKVLDKNYKVPKQGEAFLIEDVEFSESFVKNYFKIGLDAGLELFMAYPKLLYVNGKQFSATNVTKGGYRTLDDFFFTYSRSIKFDRELHEKILKALTWAEENNLLNYGIVEYVVSQKWWEHFEMIAKDKIGKFVTKFDTVQTV